MRLENILSHYMRKDVVKEIIEWSRDRWISIHCQRKDERDKRIFIRYLNGKPIEIKDENDLRNIFKVYSSCEPRTFYASINQYKRLDDRDEVFDLDNIYLTIPTWDIDNELKDWKATIEVSKIMGEELEKHGLIKSVYFKWSGRGMHIHINPRAFSEEIISRVHPLDIAYSIVEYIQKKIYDSIHQVKIRYNNRNLKVENKIDIARVFTIPLSIHRELDVVSICLKYKDLDDFNPSWIRIDNFKHNPGWREYKIGEGDNLAMEAYEIIGGCPYIGFKHRSRRKSRPVDEMIKKYLRKL